MALFRTVLLLSMFFAAPVRAEMLLYMAQEHGCYWCGKWDEEIADIYPKTVEGQTAPLIRFDIHDQKPEGVTFKRAVNFTPTFILVKDGLELSRIEGYPGEDFFWGLLSKMLKSAQSDEKIAG